MSEDKNTQTIIKLKKAKRRYTQIMASKHLATKFRQSYSLTSPILRRLSTAPQPPFRSLSEDEGRSDRGISGSPVVPRVSDAIRSIRTNLCGSESDLAVANCPSLISASMEFNNVSSSIIKGATIGPANSSLTSLTGHRISGPKGLGALFTTTKAIHSSAISKEKAANLNVHRPLSPHLPLYQPQMTSTLSIFNRIAGVYLSVLICAFPLLFLKMGVICFTFYPMYELLYYSSKLTLISVEMAALCLAYHTYSGLHHLWADFNGAALLRRIRP